MLTAHFTVRRLAHDERGFTMIEVLVAILTGVVVTGALFAILEVSLRQTSRLTDVAQATQLGRSSMTRVVDELHSACLAKGFKPIQKGSNENELIFVNAYSKEPAIATAKENAKEGAYKHVIKWESKTGTLTDYAYESTGYENAGGSSPSELTFSATAKPTTGTRIGEDISQSEIEKGGKKEKVPIFQYYQYATASSSSTTTPLGTINPTPLTATTSSPLSAANAELAASVQISFRASPTGTTKEFNDRFADFSNQVLFALSAPNSEATIEDSPCE